MRLGGRCCKILDRRSATFFLRSDCAIADGAAFDAPGADHLDGHRVDRPKGSPKRVVCTVATITGLGGVLSGAVSGAWAAAVELFLARRGRLRSSLPARLDERPFEIKEFSSGVCVRYERFDKAGADSAEDGVRLRFTSGDCKHFRYCQELFGRDGH